jgi:hypothetical protein
MHKFELNVEDSNLAYIAQNLHQQVITAIAEKSELI